MVPRTFRLAGSARTLPPRAPRNLARLPRSAEYATALAPADAVEVAARVLAGRGFRLRRAADGDPGSAGPGSSGCVGPAVPARFRPGTSGESAGSWVSAEKGYLREVGNLLFHLALLGVLVAVALGGLFGYKADRLLVEGTTFADTQSALDEFHPGRLVTAADLGPFTITLNKFDASYISSGPQRGQPSSFDAQVTYTDHPGGPARSARIQVNQPLSVDGAKVYLIGHGYAPEFKVTDARGQVVYDGPQPFIAGATGNFLSEGVVKVPDAQPEQLGFTGVFVPTAIDVGGTLESVFPAADNPVVSLIAYAGNLGENSGAPQSVYQMDTAGMRQLTATPQLLQVGQSLKLPDGQGTITFTGYRQWASLAITHDPGQLPALICGMAALGGLLLSFMVRRRRVFVRARPGPQGTTVQVGGLARTDASGGFEDEFAALAAELRAAHQAAAQAMPVQPTTGRVRAMPVNLALGHVGNDFLIAALVIYSLSVVAFAGDFAFGRPRRADASAACAGAGAGRRPGHGRRGQRRVRGGRTGAGDGPAGDATRCPRSRSPPGARSARRARGYRPPSPSPSSGWWLTRRPSSPAGLPCTGRPGATCTSSSPP